MNMPVQSRIKSIALKMLRVIEVCAKPDGAFKVVVQMSTKKLKIEEAECRWLLLQGADILDWSVKLVIKWDLFLGDL